MSLHCWTTVYTCLESEICGSKLISLLMLLNSTEVHSSYMCTVVTCQILVLLCSHKIFLGFYGAWSTCINAPDLQLTSKINKHHQQILLRFKIQVIIHYFSPCKLLTNLSILSINNNNYHHYYYYKYYVL